MLDPLDEHYGYLSDRVKLERYQAAIERMVKPGQVVMDLGCGSGLLGLMALRAGADTVYFVEEGSIIEVARRAIVEADFEDKARFLRINSYELELDDKVDVIVCDHVGYFGFDYGLLGLLADARQRFLKPDGKIIPGQIGLEVSPVETEDGRELVSRWRDESVPGDFAWVGDSAANTKHGLDLNADNLLAGPAELGSLELGAEAPEFLSWNAEAKCMRSGTLDGLLGWFNCTLLDDIHMTNSPTASDKLQRPQAFLPLDEPIPVSEGELIRATIMARPADHVIAWNVGLPAQNKQISMTTFNGLLLDEESLGRAHPDRVATLNDRGRARQVILSYCDGKHTTGEIEQLVREKHPHLFPSARAAEKFVRHVLTWDTEG